MSTPLLILGALTQPATAPSASAGIALSPWLLLLLAIPILALGDGLLKVIKPLAWCDLPGPIVGGLLIAGLVLLGQCTLANPITLTSATTNQAWTWIALAEPAWLKAPAQPIYLPLSTIFFTTVGLNASWAVTRVGGWQLLLFWAIATILGILQNFLGVALCGVLGVSKLLGMICGSLTLTGGPSTALGFAKLFEDRGFPDAAVAATAAAMFGIVTASLFGGAFGGQLVRHFKLSASNADRPLAPGSARGPSEQTAEEESIEAKTNGNTLFAPNSKVDSEGPRAEPGANGSPPRNFFQRVGWLAARPHTLLIHLVLILLCVKVGAWISYGLTHEGIPAPIYMGALLVGIAVRNIADLAKWKWLRIDVVNTIGGVALALFLVMAIASLQLIQLRHLAGPMLVILSAQIVLMLVFAFAVTFMLMGRDYDAAILSAGHVGFGLGITPNALASMDVIEKKFGDAPRAVLLVTLVGGFLIDISNAQIITFHLKWFI